MKAASSLVLIPVILLCGCGHGLSKRKAKDALTALVASESSSKWSISRHEVKAGDYIQRDYAVKYGCKGVWRPSMIDEAEISAKEGLITLKQTGPCSWHGELNPQFREDVAWEYGGPGEYQSIDLNTSKFSSLEVQEVRSKDDHGDAKVVLHFSFTPTMYELMKHSTYPEIEDKDCEYDIPKHEVVCNRRLPFMYLDKKWQIDPTRFKKTDSTATGQ